MQKEMRELFDALKREHPESQPKLTEFPSGASMLDVNVGDETYVMEYLPSLGAYGISRISTATFGWEGVEAAFNNFHDAREALHAMLKSSDEPNESG